MSTGVEYFSCLFSIKFKKFWFDKFYQKTGLNLSLLVSSLLYEKNQRKKTEFLLFYIDFLYKCTTVMEKNNKHQAGELSSALLLKTKKADLSLKQV